MNDDDATGRAGSLEAGLVCYNGAGRTSRNDAGRPSLAIVSDDFVDDEWYVDGVADLLVGRCWTSCLTGQEIVQDWTTAMLSDSSSSGKIILFVLFLFILRITSKRNTKINCFRATVQLVVNIRIFVLF